MRRTIDKIFIQLPSFILLTLAILLLPSLIKNFFPKSSEGPIWGRFISAHLLLVGQLAFYLWHPACKRLGKMGRIIIGFFLVYLFGCVISPWLSGSYRGFQELLKLFSASSLFFLILYAAHRMQGVSLLRLIAIFGCVFASGQAFLGLGQYILQHDLGLHWLGEKILDPYKGSAFMEFVGGIRWTGDPGLGSGTYALRPYGTFDHPNHFGGVMMVGLLLTSSLLLQPAKKWPTTLLAASFALQTLALTASFSRSAWLSGAIGFLILLGLYWTRHRDKPLPKSIFLALGISLAITLSVFHSQIFQRCRTESSAALTQSNAPLDPSKITGGERGQFQEVAKNMIAFNPWSGVGFREFVVKTPDYTSRGQADYFPVHNIYLLVAAELGLPVALAFLLFCLLVAIEAFRKSSSYVLTAAWCACLVIGCMDNYFLTTQTGRLLLFVLAALALLPARQSSSSS